MTFHSGSTDLNVVTLGAPHHQVREAPSAVSEVRGQAPAHTTEDGAPQAGHKILDTEHRDSQPSPGTETLKPPPVTVRWGRDSMCHSAQMCPGTPSALLLLVLGLQSQGLKCPRQALGTTSPWVSYQASARSETSGEQLRKREFGVSTQDCDSDDPQRPAVTGQGWCPPSRGHRPGQGKLPTKWAEGIREACSCL